MMMMMMMQAGATLKQHTAPLYATQCRPWILLYLFARNEKEGLPQVVLVVS